MVASLFVLSLYLLIRAQFSTMTILKVITVVVTVYSLAPSHLTTIRDVSNSSQYRVEMWAASLDMVKGNPVFGIGPGNFREWSGRLIGHNSAVEIQGELGPIGLLLWISMIYACIKGIILFRSTARDVRYKWFGMALILSVIGYVTSAMFVTLEYETFYLLLAFCSVLGRCSSVPIHFVRSDFINILSIAVVWLIYIQTFVIMYLG